MGFEEPSGRRLRADGPPHKWNVQLTAPGGRGSKDVEFAIVPLLNRDLRERSGLEIYFARAVSWSQMLPVSSGKEKTVRPAPLDKPTR
jgi:hypothetical protein